jgi:tripartite-type tricarboxylate transporter receptor subunit TctC
MKDRSMKTLRALAAVATAIVLAQPVSAQDWPNRSLTMVAPFGPGGSTDAIARIVAEGLGAQLHQSVVVENIGGAGGMTGANRVAKAAPDGYTFVLGNVGTHAQNQTLYKAPLYNAVTDFAPVGLIMDQSLILVTRKDLPPNNLQEFIAFARQNQTNLKFGSGGVGGSNHLACVLLNAALGVNVTHVPYRSAGPAMQDMLAGLIDYQCPSAPTVIPQYASNTIKTLAILSKKRSASLPDLPSAHEQGLTDFDIPSWYALFLPKGTPDPIVRKLNAAAVAAMNTPFMKERLKAIGSDLAGPERQSPEYLAQFVADEIKKWAGPIRASGVQL